MLSTSGAGSTLSVEFCGDIFAMSHRCGLLDSDATDWVVRWPHRMNLGVNGHYWYSHGRDPRSNRVDSTELKARETGNERGTKEGNGRNNGILWSYIKKKKGGLQAVSEKLLEMKHMKDRTIMGDTPLSDEQGQKAV